MAFNPNYSILTRGSENLARSLGGLGQNIGQGIANVAEGYMQGQQAESNQQQAAEMQNLVGLAMGGNPEAITQLGSVNPELAMKIQDRATESQQADKLALRDNTVKAIEMLHKTPDDQKDELFAKMVGDPTLDIDEDDTNFIRDEGVIRAILTDAKGKEYADAFMGATPKGVQSLPAEAQAFNDLIKNFTPEQQKTARLIKAGLKGRAITNAELTAIEDGTINSYSQYKTEQKQKEKFAEATGANRAKIIDAGFESINKANTSLRNIDKAILALDKGAGVGAIEKLWPSITASSVELDNIRGQMALDVVGATTFGALSEGELNLAKDVALPTGLDTNELKDYLSRKKAAQEKLRDYYNEQIQHLDGGGTVASFLRKKGAKADTSGASNADLSNVSDEDLFK